MLLQKKAVLTIYIGSRAAVTVRMGDSVAIEIIFHEFLDAVTEFPPYDFMLWIVVIDLLPSGITVAEGGLPLPVIIRDAAFCAVRIMLGSDTSCTVIFIAHELPAVFALKLCYMAFLIIGILLAASCRIFY